MRHAPFEELVRTDLREIVRRDGLSALEARINTMLGGGAVIRRRARLLSDSF